MTPSFEAEANNPDLENEIDQT